MEEQTVQIDWCRCRFRQVRTQIFSTCWLVQPMRLVPIRCTSIRQENPFCRDSRRTWSMSKCFSWWRIRQMAVVRTDSRVLWAARCQRALLHLSQTIWCRVIPAWLSTQAIGRWMGCSSSSNNSNNNDNDNNSSNNNKTNKRKNRMQSVLSWQHGRLDDRGYLIIVVEWFFLSDHRIMYRMNDARSLITGSCIDWLILALWSPDHGWWNNVIVIPQWR